MKVPSWHSKPARIEIIPMIDTIFFLLVFFMVATLSMTIQRGMTVNLPTAATAEHISQDIVTVSLTKTGELFYDRERMASITDMQARLAQIRLTTQPSIIINADEDVAHGEVVRILDAIRKSGITKMAIASKPRGKQEQP